MHIQRSILNIYVYLNNKNTGKKHNYKNKVTISMKGCEKYNTKSATLT